MAKEFRQENLEEIREILTYFPNDRAALLPVLRVAEEEFGYIDIEACQLVADVLKLNPAHIYGVLTFYTHFKREWHGKHRIMVCSTLMCALRQSQGIVAHIEKKLGIRVGQTTEDGIFSLEKVECLASCGTSPSMQIDDVHYENLTIEKVDEIIDNLMKE